MRRLWPSKHNVWWATGAVALSLAACVLWVGWRANERARRAVVRIGADSTPPFSQWDADGQLRGLGPDILNEAARRRGIHLEWVRPPGGGEAGLQRKAVDLWLLMAATPQRLARFHITRPWIRNEMAVLSSDKLPFHSVSELQDRLVALVNGPATRYLASGAMAGALLVPAKDRASAVKMLCRGEVDATFVEMYYFHAALLSRPAGCEDVAFQSFRVSEAYFDLGTASTWAAAGIADELRDEIDALHADGFFDQQLSFWAPFSGSDTDMLFQRQKDRNRTILFGASAVLALVVLLMLLWQNRRVVSARLEAEHASTAKSEFIANLSHEIRTPMTGLLGTIELLGAGPLDPAQSELVSIARDSARSLLTLLNQMLDLKKIESGKLELEHVAFSWREIVESVLASFRSETERRGLTLELIESGPVPAHLAGDPVRFRQVITNLLSNAVKFTERGGVRVELSAHNDRMRIGVRDTGIGLSDDQIALLFKKFSQADSSISKRYGGTGLGLAISKALVELMDGEVGIESRVGQGSLFWFELPLGAAQALELVPALPRVPHGGAARVLLVDDNAVNRHVCTALLSKAGCEVESAAGGQEAVEKTLQSHYDMVFMDCFMPGMDGFEAAARIRQSERAGRRTPIIALTASVMAADLKRATASGMDDVLSKPIDLMQLDRVLRQWASQPGA